MQGLLIFNILKVFFTSVSKTANRMQIIMISTILIDDN